MAAGAARRAVATAAVVVASMLVFATGLQAVSIVRMSVPAEVELDAVKSFLLECQYRIADAADLSVEWYFKQAEVNTGGRRSGGIARELVYRQTPGQPPQVFGVLRDKIEAAATEEELPKVSRLRVTHPDVLLSGEYTCEVSAGGDVARATRSLLVYSGEHNLMLKAQRRDREGVVELTCSVENVYPVPDLKIERLDAPNTTTQPNQWQQFQQSDNGNGLLNAHATARMNINELRNVEHFSCRLSLMQTAYHATKKLTFQTRSEKNIEITEQPSVTAPAPNNLTAISPVPSTTQNTPKGGAAQLTSSAVLSAAVTVLALAAI